MYEIVKCDNCGAEYITFDTDENKGPFWHRVCDTCYLPMKVKNPFYKEASDLTETTRRNSCESSTSG